MSRQFLLFAALSLLLLLQHTIVCNGRATSSKEDELAALAKRLRELIADGHKDVGKNEEEHEDDSEEHEDHEGEDEDHEDDSEEHDDHEEEHEEHEEHESVKHSSKHQSRGGGLTDAQKQKVIEIHNKMRLGEGASNMHKLKYNDKLASLAQDWSDRCGWGHRPHESFNPNDYGYKFVGENIWAWSDDSKEIPDQPIADWFAEKNYYNYDSLSCSKEPCGHYTAVVWHSTQEVGCGLTKCSTLNNAGMSNANFFVCNYGPGGNNQGEKPYKKGNPCTQCATGQFYCTNDMCDHTCSSAGSGGNCECKAHCVHGSVTSDCKCQCNAGHTGSDCSETCEDKDPQCGANPGWPDMFCDKNFFGGAMYDTVIEKCPKMCKRCTAKKRENEELEYLAALKQRMADEKK